VPSPRSCSVPSPVAALAALLKALICQEHWMINMMCSTQASWSTVATAHVGRALHCCAAAPAPSSRVHGSRAAVAAPVLVPGAPLL
jgi:hypothetical protein